MALATVESAWYLVLHRHGRPADNLHCCLQFVGNGERLVVITVPRLGRIFLCESALPWHWMSSSWMRALMILGLLRFSRKGCLVAWVRKDARVGYGFWLL